MLDDLIQSMKQAIQELKQYAGKSIQLFHHNDSDGLSSGAILQKAFTRQGFAVHRFCLEKPYPVVLKKVFQQEGGIIVFADFAGRIAPLISTLNQGRNLALILDHHVAEPATDPMVHNLDPELYGMKGDRDITASTTCYLFAITLNRVNQDMAHIATIGAVGDGFFVDGRLADQNRKVALEAVRQGQVEIRLINGAEQYLLKTTKGHMPLAEFGAYLDTLGAAGYYQNGPDMGVRVCLEGISQESDRVLEKLKNIQSKAFKEEISRIQKGALKKTAHIQWFHVENRLAPMGVKMIGAFCDTIKNTKYIDPTRYIAGFQIIPNEIPKFGPIQFGEVKISMRVSDYLAEKIRTEDIMGLDVLLTEATGRLGGFSDACHRLTAATTVAMGKEEALIEEMEKILRTGFKVIPRP
ncbi:MAG: DHH family phosphoesterase [Desulfobacterales bacterium]|nr:MAG: DHH family phosphoesterase [Desulfobacterales bacterium]